MAVARRKTPIHFGNEFTPIAPQLNGCQPANAYTWNASSYWSMDLVLANTNPYGKRIHFTASKDFSVRKYIAFGSIFTTFGLVSSYMDTVANGGLRFFCYDTSGNYVGFKVYGYDIPNYTALRDADGFFVSNGGVESTTATEWMIDRARTPDYSSGTINWAQIAGVELHYKSRVTYGTMMPFYFRNLQLTDEPLLTGGTVGTPRKMIDFNTELTTNNPTIGYRCYRQFQRVPYQFFGGSGIGYAPQIGFDIGDGSTSTVFTESKVAIGFWNPHDTSPAYQSMGPIVQMGPDFKRLATINQSATDIVTLTDVSWASSLGWGLEVKGNTGGTANFVRNTFVRSNYFKAGHGNYTDCVWDTCDYVEVGALTDITGGLIRSTPAGKEGLKITGGPGDYRTLTLNFSGNVDRDLTINPTGPGIFDCRSLTVDGTMRIHNASATHAITVKLSQGIAYSTTTAGGAITIDIPLSMATAQIQGIGAGSRVHILNITTNTVVHNDVIAGTSWSLEYTEGTTFTSGDYIRVRITKKENIQEQYTTIAGASGWAVLANPVLDTTYQEYGVDGSTCTEFTWDGTNLEIDITDSDNSTQIQRIGAWYKYYITTVLGINEIFGAVTWEKINEIRINSGTVNLKLDNKKTTPLLLTGGRAFRSDGSTIIASTSGSIHLDYDPVYMVETGTSGLTNAESLQLAGIGSIVENVNKIKPNTDLIPALL